MSIKGLQPTLREKKRYIAYTVKSQNSVSQQDVISTINQELLQFLGENTYADAGIQLLPETSTTGIIRVNHLYTPHTIVGVSLITQINKNPTHIQPIITSGILTKARKAIKRRNT